MSGFDLAKFRALPPAMTSAILSVDALATMERIEEEFGVQLMVPIARLATGELKWSGFVGAIESQGKLPLVAIAVRDRVQHDLLRDVLAQMDPDAAPPCVPFDDVLEAAADAAGVVGDARRGRRFRDAVESYLRNARTDVQTKDVLVRSEKIGGVGLAPDVAAQVIAVLGPQRGRVQFDDATPPVRSSVPTPAPPVADALALSSDEERLLDYTAKPAARGSAVDAAVERVVRMTGARFGSAETAQRFHTALASRFRDVRDAEETRAVLLRPYAEGGMGLPAETVRKLSMVIEREAQKVLGVADVSPRAAAVPKRRELTLATPALPAPAPTTPVLRPESQISNFKYQIPATPPPPPPLISKPVASVSPPIPKPVPSPVVAQPVPPPVVKIAAPPLTDGGLTPVIRRGDESAATRPPPPPPPLKLAPVPVPPQPKPPVPRPVAPPPPTDGELTPVIRRGTELAATSVATPAPQPSRSAPVVSRADNAQIATRNSQLIRDIRPPRPKLVGPIEELEQLTIDDFRKIAKTPADAAAKIAEKLTLLDRRSHTDRAQGLKALRGSPLFTAYADILNTALGGGTTLDVVIAASGTLSKEEFEAVMDLNTQLRV